jgi:hypothetical protein
VRLLSVEPSVSLTRVFEGFFRLEARTRDAIRCPRDPLFAAAFLDRRRCLRRGVRAACSFPFTGLRNNAAQCGAITPMAEIALWPWPVPYAAPELRGVFP